MALIHQATLTPSKIELLSAWVPTRPWLDGIDASALTPVGAYRFDDPDGEVGIETHLLETADGRVLQVPVTYRGAPLPGGDEWLIATTEHSVLGRRWVYDALLDPVYLPTLVGVIRTGGTQADLDVATDSGLRRRVPTTRVSGSGSGEFRPPALWAVIRSTSGTTTTLGVDGVRVVVRHVIDAEARAPGDADTLTGIWPGQEVRALLAHAGRA